MPTNAFIDIVNHAWKCVLITGTLITWSTAKRSSASSKPFGQLVAFSGLIRRHIGVFFGLPRSTSSSSASSRPTATTGAFTSLIACLTASM
jgi:hypothetical protein